MTACVASGLYISEPPGVGDFFPPFLIESFQDGSLITFDIHISIQFATSTFVPRGTSQTPSLFVRAANQYSYPEATLQPLGFATAWRGFSGTGVRYTSHTNQVHPHSQHVTTYTVKIQQ